MAETRNTRADDAQRRALHQRLRRLKLTAAAAVAGTWLVLWTLVAGAVAGSTSTAQPPATRVSSQQGAATVDFFGRGSSIGLSSGTPVLRSHGS